MKLGEVTIVKDCMICHREVILLARRDARGELPPKDSILPQVCEECEKKYLKEGILMINPNNGRLAVLKEAAFRKMFGKRKRDAKGRFMKGQDETFVQTLKKRIAFTDDKLLDIIFAQGGIKH